MSIKYVLIFYAFLFFCLGITICCRSSNSIKYKRKNEYSNVNNEETEIDEILPMLSDSN